MKLVHGAVAHKFQLKVSTCNSSFIQMSVYSILFVTSSGKDFMCVQSTDGMLSFFEQESYAFGRFLPGFLLPGPLTYVAKTDSFLTVSSSLLVESYKYVHACFTVIFS